MKKVLLTLLAILVILGALGGAGFAGYRIGYSQGIQANPDVVMPRFDRLPGFDRDAMPQFRQGMDERFNRDFAPNHVFMMQRGGGFFSPFQFIWRLLVIGLVIWLGYQLFKGNGWQLSLTRNSPAPAAGLVSTSEEPAAPRKKTAKADG